MDIDVEGISPEQLQEKMNELDEVTTDAIEDLVLAAIEVAGVIVRPSQGENPTSEEIDKLEALYQAARRYIGLTHVQLIVGRALNERGQNGEGEGQEGEAA